MNAFANRLTLKIGSLAGGISFTITAVGIVIDLDTFHGGWVQFFAFVGSGLIDCAFNGAMTFVLAAIITLPLMRYLEGRIYQQRLHAAEQKAAASDAGDR